MLAYMTKVSELKIDESEGKILATGIANVAKHYDIGGADAKTLDWFNLFQSLAIVYGPRIYMIRANRPAKSVKTVQQPPTKSAEQASFDAQGGTPFDGVPVQVQL